MKLLTILASAAFVAFAAAPAAFATECKKQGGGYVCPGNVYVDGSKAESSAEALAIATAKAEQSQGQQQGQVQGQIAEGGNAYNGGNSVAISNPKHTTSMSLGVGINFSVPIASGVQTRNAIDTANWFIQNGMPCPAYKVMEKAPRVRALKINISCGDKG